MAEQLPDIYKSLTLLEPDPIVANIQTMANASNSAFRGQKWLDTRKIRTFATWRHTVPSRTILAFELSPTISRRDQPYGQ